MMALCDSAVRLCVINENYKYLSMLTPVKRAAELFRLETEKLEFSLEVSDEIFGWFLFDRKDKSLENRQFSCDILNKETEDIIKAPGVFGCTTNVDRGHTLVDYGYLIDHGLIAYQEKIEEELLSAPENEYLLAMQSVLLSVRAFVDRMICAAEQNVNHCERASEIAAALRQVPFYPARNFREAIQSVWIIHFLIPLAENAWYSISLGKFDQYMYPYYRRSLSDGMTGEEIKRILYHFYRLLNSYADGACMLNVGGEEYNELSKLVIECQKEFSLPAPILGARITKHTEDEIFDILIDEKLFCVGQPTFYGEHNCIGTLVEKGVDPEIAAGFSNNSCMGISLPSEEFNSMWGCVFNVSAILEAAVNCGKCLYKDFTVAGIAEVNGVEELYQTFEKAADMMFEICVKAYKVRAGLSETCDPDPLVSLLTYGCIEKHCDRITGSKYHNVTVECMGMVNVSDGICAIDRLVWKEKKYTLGELSIAVKNNFRGYEAIRKDILRCSKYGQDSEADEYAVRIAEILQRVIRKYNCGNMYFCPSLHTLDTNVGYGSAWGAGYDGRAAGAPFAKNAGPSNEVRKKDPTALLMSAACLPQHKFYGGQPVDINFGREIVKNQKRKIAALIRTYFEKGGLQMQVNSLSPDMLEDAVKNPKNYNDLIVRIGGYSIYFNRLSEKTKQEFIQRIKRESM